MKPALHIVQRTLRILRLALTLLFLLLCLASLVFWIRGYFVKDVFILTPFPNQWSLSANRGALLIQRNHPWLNPADVKAGIKPQVYQRSFLGFGVAEAQELRTWQGESPRTISYLTSIKTYSIPLWFCFALFSIPPLIRLRHLATSLRRRRRGLCPHCGYDLRASPNLCPECGRS